MNHCRRTVWARYAHHLSITVGACDQLKIGDGFGSAVVVAVCVLVRSSSVRSGAATALARHGCYSAVAGSNGFGWFIRAARSSGFDARFVYGSAAFRLLALGLQSAVR